MEEAYVNPHDVLTEKETPGLFYWKEITFFLLFIFVTPLTILASAVSVFALSKKEETPRKTAQIYAALPQSRPAVAGNVIGEDARVVVLQKFLDENKSELTPFAELLVQTADKYQLDWKLLPAIAQKESGLCRVIPPGSYNCWGWGIHSKGTLMFDDYPEAIEAVAKGLKEKYIDYGLTTPEKIMTKYANPNSTTWAEGVILYMEQIKNLSLTD